jgi:hypothetical protein
MREDAEEEDLWVCVCVCVRVDRKTAGMVQNAGVRVKLMREEAEVEDLWVCVDGCVCRQIVLSRSVVLVRWGWESMYVPDWKWALAGMRG